MSFTRIRDPWDEQASPSLTKATSFEARWTAEGSAKYFTAGIDVV